MVGSEKSLADFIEAGLTVKVGILLFPEVEVLDFAGPFEVFSVASRIAGARQVGAMPVFEVSTVAAQRSAVVARHGLTVEPAYGFDDAPAFDLFVVPGGVVTQPLNDPATLAYLGAVTKRAHLTASVCTGAFLLAKLGLLDGRRATTHWEDIPDLKAAFPRVTVIGDVPYVDQGAIVTSAGISAGIGMSLHLVGRIMGLPMAVRAARQMQFDWVPA